MCIDTSLFRAYIYILYVCQFVTYIMGTFCLTDPQRGMHCVLAFPMGRTLIFAQDLLVHVEKASSTSIYRHLYIYILLIIKKMLPIYVMGYLIFATSISTAPSLLPRGKTSRMFFSWKRSSLLSFSYIH